MSTNAIAGFRLSQQQERVWTQWQAKPAAHFGAQCVVMVEGLLDLPKLRVSAEKLVARHEILRTSFQRQSGLKLPFQVIREAGSAHWDDIDFRYHPASSQQEKLEEVFQETAGRNVDFDQGPGLRVVVAALAKDRHAVILSVPALCGDARSLGNIVDELWSVYNGQEPEADVMQYADYVEWQHELL